MAQPPELRDKLAGCRSFSAKPKATVPADPDDYDVKSGGLTVGRIYKAGNITGDQPAWYWTINGIHAGPDVMGVQGFEHSREDAMAKLRENRNKWLAWAILKEGP